MKLEPVKVPWKLSSSDEIEIFRSNGGCVELFLIADLINGLSKSMNLSENPDTDIFTGINIVQICLTFHCVQYFEFSRPRLEVFGLDPQKYDFPKIDYSDRAHFFQTWFLDQLCPAPNMFQVKNSDIKKRLNIPEDTMSHWLLTGHDEIVNVIAESFSWNVVEYLR